MFSLYHRKNNKTKMSPELSYLRSSTFKRNFSSENEISEVNEKKLEENLKKCKLFYIELT